MMSEQQEHSNTNNEEEEFIDRAQIGEVVEDIPREDGEEPMEEDDEEEGQQQQQNEQEEVLEIDMSNNSYAFFDAHTNPADIENETEEDQPYCVTLVESHPSLPMVVTGGTDNMAYLWTTHKEEPTVVAKLNGHTESVITGGFTADGKYVVTGDMTGQARIWRSMKKGEKWEFFDTVQEVEEIVWITLHPKQNIFALGASDGSVWVYAIEPQLENVAVLSAHSATSNSGIFVDVDDMDNLSLVTVADDFTIINWNVYSASPKYTLGDKALYGEHPWVSLSLSPNGKAFAAGASDGTLAIVNVENGNIITRLDTSPSLELESRSIEAISWSDSHKLLAIGNVGGEIQLYDVGTWKLRKTLKAEDAITKLRFLSGTPLLISSSYDSKVVKWNVLTGEPKWTSQGHGQGILGFAVQEKGTRIISGDDEGVCLVFNTEQAPAPTQSVQLSSGAATNE